MPLPRHHHHHLRHVRNAQTAAGQASCSRWCWAAPVYFVDGPERDACRGPLRAPQAVGFEAIHFQFEPIAAAFDYEQQVQEEQKVLVADIGGGV